LKKALLTGFRKNLLKKRGRLWMQIITIKDILFIISLASVIAGFIYRIKIVESKLKRVMKTIYHENGGHNVITLHECKSHRDNVFTAIRKGERMAAEIVKEIKMLNENVLRTKIHLKINTDRK